MPVDLQDAKALKAACLDVDQEARSKGHWATPWRSALSTFLQWVALADRDEREKLAFQKKLWDDNPVTSVGMGTVRVDEALADDQFRAWIATVSLESLPHDVVARTARLDKIQREMLDRVSKHTDRVPRLKVLRVMAALFPSDFTTIADGARPS